MNARNLVCLVAMSLLAACACGKNRDLQEFMQEIEKNAPRRIEPLPQIQTYEPFEYAGYDLPDPFHPRKLTPAKSAGAFQPDLNRRKEPLESYPLESLQMVGTLRRGGEMFALVRADKTIYRVAKGNYMGQNFGQVVAVNDQDVQLKEVVQDSLGDWAERMSTLTLIEDNKK